MSAVATIRARFQVMRGAFDLDVDLEIPARGVTAIFGASGSGKTSILRAIAGLDRLPGGRLQIGDEVWQDEAHGVFVPVHRRALGYVFQEAHLFPHMSVRANLDYSIRRRRRTAVPVSFDDTIGLLGIGHLLDRLPQNLSGGERQRAAIARALLASPRLLLLDEPLASLDQERKREILPYLERLHDELAIPVLYVSHAADEVVRLADHLVLVSAGRITAHGPLSSMLARLDLPEVLSRDVGVVVEGTVAHYDPDYGLVRLDLAGGNGLHVSHAPAPIGKRLRVQIQSRDVSLALAEPTTTSVLNLLPAKIVSMGNADPGDAPGAHVVVLLDAAGTPLVARITRYSHDRLHLQPGMEVWAQIKAVAVVT